MTAPGTWLVARQEIRTRLRAEGPGRRHGVHQVPAAWPARRAQPRGAADPRRRRCGLRSWAAGLAVRAGFRSGPRRRRRLDHDDPVADSSLPGSEGRACGVLLNFGRNW